MCTNFFSKLINFIKFILLLFIYFNQSFSDELVNLRYGANDDKKRIVLDLKKDLIFDSRIFSKKIYERLKKIDAKAAEKIKANDSQRIMRALEVNSQSKILFSDLLKTEKKSVLEDYEKFTFAVIPRCNKTF